MKKGLWLRLFTVFLTAFITQVSLLAEDAQDITDCAGDQSDAGPHDLLQLLFLLELKQESASCPLLHSIYTQEKENLQTALSSFKTQNDLKSPKDEAIELLSESDNIQHPHTCRSLETLRLKLWEQMLALNDEGLQERAVLYNGLGKNPLIPHAEELAIRRHLLPYGSYTREALDTLFLHSRAVQSPEAFIQSGFIPLIPIHSNKIVVATHPLIPGMIFKTYLDCYPVNKSGTADWLWLSRRCILANKIRKSIEKNKYTYFTVPKKWLYPIPGQGNERVHALLVAEKMNLVSHLENKEAWLNLPQEALRQLLDIMLTEGGQSYRPDNIWKTEEGKFAFIDTEYPHLPPRFLEVIAYLSPETQHFWKMLVIQRIFSARL